MENKIKNQINQAEQQALDDEYKTRYANRWKDRQSGIYYMENGVIGLIKKEKDKIVDGQWTYKDEKVALTDNFSALIAQQLILDDGLKPEIAYLIEGKHKNGRFFPTLTILSAHYHPMQWTAKHWGSKAIIDASQTAPRRTAHAILKLSCDLYPDGEIPTITIFKQTGWRKIEDKWYYLTAAGGIHAEGLDESIEVELGDGHINKYNIPAPPADQRHDGRGFLDLLTLSIKNPKLGAVLFASTPRAVLGEALRIDSTLFFYGRTGTGKSETAAIMLAFFGLFDSRSFPANFQDTETDLQTKAHTAKDAIYVIDDYLHAVSIQKSNENQAKLEYIGRSAGNQAGRGRRNADLTGKAAHFPRGFCVVTGEDMPKNNASLVGRFLIVEFQCEMLDSNQLNLLRDFARSGRLRADMFGFIQWLAPQMDELKKSFPDKVKKLAQRHWKSFPGAHTRAPDMFASLFCAGDLLIEYLIHTAAISEVAAVDLAENLENNLMDIMMLQGQFQKQMDEVERFINLLKGCFSSGDVHVSDPLTNGPPKINPFIFGWRAANEGGDPGGCGARIGWVDESKAQLLLDPDPTFKAVQRFASSQNEPILMNKSTLWRRLQDRGFLLECDTDRPTKKVTINPSTRQRANVLVMAAGLIIGTSDEQ